MNKQYTRPFKVRKPLRIIYLQKLRSEGSKAVHYQAEGYVAGLWQYQCTEENPNRLTTSPMILCQLADGYAVISGVEICVSKAPDRLLWVYFLEMSVIFIHHLCKWLDEKWIWDLEFGLTLQILAKEILKEVLMWSLLSFSYSIGEITMCVVKRDF